MILGGPKDTITSLWTKSLKALVPPNSFGPPPMGGVGVDFKDRAPSAGSGGPSLNCPLVLVAPPQSEGPLVPLDWEEQDVL